MFRRRKTGEQNGINSGDAGDDTPGHELPALKPFLRSGSDDASRIAQPAAQPVSRVELTRRLEMPAAAARMPTPTIPAYVPHPAAQPATPETEGKKLIVGRDIRLAGEIAACEHLVVEGSVEATLSDGKMVELAETGSFHGSVDCETAVIRGRFEGELVCRDRLVVRATGHVMGKVRYNQLEVERGGEISGDVQKLEQQPALVAASNGAVVNGDAQPHDEPVSVAVEQ